MPDTKLRYYFDTVVLSNFALVNRLDLLNTLYHDCLFVTTEVVDEISRGIISGFTPLQSILHSIEDGLYFQHTLSVPERNTYTSLLVNLGSGEASSIAAAHTVNGVVVTDDKLARKICSERGLKVSGTVGILKKLYVTKVVQSMDADSILADMIDNGFFSPVSSISDII